MLVPRLGQESLQLSFGCGFSLGHGGVLKLGPRRMPVWCRSIPRCMAALPKS